MGDWSFHAGLRWTHFRLPFNAVSLLMPSEERSMANMSNNSFAEPLNSTITFSHKARRVDHDFLQGFANDLVIRHSIELM
jgi:hypothetical protein